MPRKGFNINSCGCGEILIDFGSVQDSIEINDLPDAKLMENLKDGERYCSKCKKIVNTQY